MEHDSLLYLPLSVAEFVMSMGMNSGAKDLSFLLKNMSPRLIEGQYVFCTVSSSRERPNDAQPVMAFLEKEGLTLIISRDEAERNGLPYNQTWAMITLEVHSDLQAVGFLAAVTMRLARLGISTNVVSAFHHDHVFVQSDRSDEAMKALKEMTREAKRTDGHGAI